MKTQSPMSLAELRSNFDAMTGSVRNTLRDDPGIKHIGVHATIQPGRHWLFTPHAHNALLWWREVLASQNEIRRSLLEAWTLHIQREFGEYVRHTYPLFPSMRNRLNRIGQLRDAELRHLAGALYSFREKIAWLLYEIVSVTSHLEIPRKHVGFSSVLRALRALPPSVMETNKRDRVIKSLEGLDGKDARVTMAFRHNVTHALRPRIDTEQPLLMFRRSDGSWDAQSPLPILCSPDTALCHLDVG